MSDGGLFQWQVRVYMESAFSALVPTFKIEVDAKMWGAGAKAARNTCKTGHGGA